MVENPIIGLSEKLANRCGWKQNKPRNFVISAFPGLFLDDNYLVIFRYMFISWTQYNAITGLRILYS